jgi:hypothetical protein
MQKPIITSNGKFLLKKNNHEKESTTTGGLGQRAKG